MGKQVTEVSIVMFNHTMEFYEMENRNIYPYLLTSSYVYYVIKTGDITGGLMTHLYLPIFIYRYTFFIYRYTFKFTFKSKLNG